MTYLKNVVGYQEIDLHMIFYIKLGENFRHKSRLVAGENKKEYLISITYSLMELWDSVRICLQITELNDLDLHTADIENAYSTDPCQEKIMMRARP